VVVGVAEEKGASHQLRPLWAVVYSGLRSATNALRAAFVWLSCCLTVMRFGGILDARGTNANNA
jgi:hypothetical protein